MNCPVADDGIRGKNEKYGENPKLVQVVDLLRSGNEPLNRDKPSPLTLAFFRLKTGPGFGGWNSKRIKTPSGSACSGRHLTQGTQSLSVRT